MKDELINLGANVNFVNPSLFYWKESNYLIGTLACHFNDITWGGNDNFKVEIIDKLRRTLILGSKKKEMFPHTLF